MTKLFALLFTLIMATSASAQGCFPFCDTGKWKSARCDILCNLDFWQSATIDGIQEILASDIDIDADDGRGWEAIHYAAMFGTADMVSALLDAGADPDGHHRQNNTESPLLVVTAPYGSEFKNSLFLNNVRSHAIFEEEQQIPFQYTATGMGGRIALKDTYIQRVTGISAVLISAGAEMNFVDSEGHTALANSVRYGIIQITALLLDVGADVNIANDDGQVPFHQTATQSDGVDFIDSLLNAGAILDATDAYGNTTLHWATLHKTFL